MMRQNLNMPSLLEGFVWRASRSIPWLTAMSRLAPWS